MNPKRIFRPGGAVIARLVIVYGLLSLAPIVLVATVFYQGTVGAMDQQTNDVIVQLSARLVAHYRTAQSGELAREIERQLQDGIDSEREIFLLRNYRHQYLAGNLLEFNDAHAPFGRPFRTTILRQDIATPVQLCLRRLGDGSTLVVGHDVTDHEVIRQMFGRALWWGAALSLVLIVAGALVFRQQIEQRVGEIRKAARAIGKGDLGRRLAVHGVDQFSLLNNDINQMMDRIGHLMDGVRHVSDAIAHDLRTPLGRVRNRLIVALRQPHSVHILADAARGAVCEIDQLNQLFERLLCIAQAEAGVRSHVLACVDLNQIAFDMAEMYGDMAAEHGFALVTPPAGPAISVKGDRNLLASAVASLLDNAIRHASPGTCIEVWCRASLDGACIAVQDNGPGIPANEYGKVTQRFYRLDKSHGLPGNGIGLATVSASARLHGASCRLRTRPPGSLRN